MKKNQRKPKSQPDPGWWKLRDPKSGDILTVFASQIRKVGQYVPFDFPEAVPVLFRSMELAERLRLSPSVEPMGFQPVPAVREDYEYYCEMSQDGNMVFCSKNASEPCLMVDNLHRAM